MWYTNPLIAVLAIVFVLGYLLIALEHKVAINKAASALLAGVLTWFIFIEYGEGEMHARQEMLYHHLSDISQILFFLMSAMTIVEIINAHHGFEVIGSFLYGRSYLSLYWIVMVIGFFLSSVLDNLTTLIVMVSLVKRLIKEHEMRWVIGSGLVLAVNAGGAWTPIGDVTTTMLWIQEKIDTIGIMQALFIPSLVSLAVFGLLQMRQIGDGYVVQPKEIPEPPPRSKTVFLLGIASLISVPIMKIFLGIPPFLGILLGVAVLWLLTDLFHSRYEDRHHLRVYHLLGNVDMSCILFFLGILMAVDALQSANVLSHLSQFLMEWVGSSNSIAVLIGFISAVVDNVPLVAAAMKMYPLEVFPTGHEFWNLLAYCAGVGGTLLIIGSAPGVALMSLERVTFTWYLRRVSGIATVSYLAGVVAYFFFRGVVG